MPQMTMLCLANSRKLGGRCVAGLREDNGRWLRPVGPHADGTLYPPNFMLNDNTEAGVLDVVQLHVSAARPACHQPENWVLDNAPWILLRRPADVRWATSIRAAIWRGAELLCGFSDRIAYSDLQIQPTSTSLALIAPQEFRMYHQLSYNGRAQARGQFELKSSGRAASYDLAVTDPIWGPKILANEPRVLRNPADRVLLTISLGEEFGGYCYKLIAAIILVPAHLPINFS